MASVWIAQEQDLPDVARLLIAFRDWWQRDEPPDDAFLDCARRLMADPDAEFLLAATAPGKAPAGVCQLRYRFVVWVGAEECNIEDVFVLDDARRAGLGRALVEVAIERARERGCERMQLDANEANPAAIALYESFGFGYWFDPPGGRNFNLRLPL